MIAAVTTTDNKDDGSPLTRADFTALMAPLMSFQSRGSIAIAVSGGPDSMALSCLAKDWAEESGLHLLGLTVDHRLRANAGQEAEQVHGWYKDLGLDHHVLVWEEGPSVGQLDRSPQAAAREARFELLCAWCRDRGISTVLLAHHADDQIETFLQRLVRGSGVDGLAAMAPKMKREGIEILRPLLSRSKADLIATCKAYEQPWIEDPSNQDEQYSRVRLRKLLSVLAAEGLSKDRLLDTVHHMQRVKDAIDHAVDEVFESAARRSDVGSLSIDLNVLLAAPEEVGLRCLARCLCQVSGAHYPPRFERLSRLYQALSTADWWDRTLHGCQVRVADSCLDISLEAVERQNSA